MDSLASSRLLEALDELGVPSARGAAFALGVKFARVRPDLTTASVLTRARRFEQFLEAAQDEAEADLRLVALETAVDLAGADRVLGLDDMEALMAAAELALGFLVERRRAPQC